MTRESIPCFYRKQEYYSLETESYHTRYAIVEVFPVSELATGDEYLLLTKDSHQYMLDVRQTPEERTLPAVTLELRHDRAYKQLYAHLAQLYEE